MLCQCGTWVSLLHYISRETEPTSKREEGHKRSDADFISRRFKEYHLCDKEPPGTELRCRPRLDDLVDDHPLHHCHFPETQDGEEKHESQVGRDERPRRGKTRSSAIPER